MPDIVPFGKYRGQPVEVLAADRDYTDWLMAQPWFRDRYQNIYTIVVNNQQPSETPEHNALQVLFLDEAYRLAFVHAAYPDTMNRARAGLLEWREIQAERIRNAEATLSNCSERFYKREEYQENLTALQEEMRRSDPDGETIVISTKVAFEKSGVDVVIAGKFSTPSGFVIERAEGEWLRIQIGIEVKPSVGDDYPAVLRQMRALDSHTPMAEWTECRFLFLEKYTGVGATEDQFRKVFEASGKRVIFRHEVEGLL